MADFTNSLAEILRSHDSEAPSSSSLYKWTPPRRSRSHLVGSFVAATVMLAAAVIITVAARTSHHNHSPAGSVGPLNCPGAYEPAAAPDQVWVPAAPSLADASSALVSSTAPTSALLCAYDGGDLKSNLLAGDLSLITNDLHLLPKSSSGTRGCSLGAAKGTGENYLLGLTYPDGVEWISMPGNRCRGSGNGSFLTTANLSAAAAAANAAGRWVPTTGAVSCNNQFGRMGDDRALAPPGAAAVYVCSAGHEIPRELAGQAARLASLVNSATISRSDYVSCADGTTDSLQARFLFQYPTGPPVLVFFNPDCTPSLTNGSIRGQLSDSAISELRADLK